MRISVFEKDQVLRSLSCYVSDLYLVNFNDLIPLFKLFIYY